MKILLVNGYQKHDFCKGELNFSLYYPITGVYRKRNGDIELVYFTDGLNPPRVININKVYGAGTELNLSLQKRVERIPNLDVKVNEDFGLLESGSYNVAIKLIDEDFEFVDNGCFMLTLTAEEMKILNDVKDRLY